ncbi:MAG: RNA-binding protein [Bdellovibrionaceae bacterium]|nr:RNA-binding protein [Pseudobdellovibrionaceae bacterium]NUM57407.1 RNA-binding protein [Pseudobdellovibrionaceae bacterium]
MGKKIYVGNLSFSVSEEQLSSAFAQYGAVDSAKVVTDRETGRSKGFGFVEMPVDSEADQAIEKLNGADLNGRNINVSEARPQENKPRRGFGGPRGGGGGGGRGGFGGGGNRGGGFGGGNRGPRSGGNQ